MQGKLMTNTDNKRSRGNTGVLPADHTGRGAQGGRGGWGPPRCHFVGGKAPAAAEPGPTGRDWRGSRARTAGEAPGLVPGLPALARGTPGGTGGGGQGAPGRAGE